LRGECLSPLSTPVLKSDDNVVLVWIVSHLGGDKAAGVILPWRSGFKKTFLQSQKTPLMDFVFVTLCGLCTFQTEIMIYETEFLGDRTFPAGAACIL
jgi:hypothetical protein